MREIQLTEWVTIPGLSTDPSDPPDPSNDGLPPVPGADEATFTVVAQFSDVGTAPGIEAPPAEPA